MLCSPNKRSLYIVRPTIERGLRARTKRSGNIGIDLIKFFVYVLLPGSTFCENSRSMNCSDLGKVHNP